MGERKLSPSFSVVQVACAWLIGLLLGAGALGARVNSWRAALFIPLMVGGFVTVASVFAFVSTHWSDHE